MKKANRIVSLLVVVLQITASFSASEESVERQHISVPSQLMQWYANCEQRVGQETIERAHGFFVDLEDQEQYAIAQAILIKRFEIHEAFMGLCNVKTMRELHIIAQLQQELKALIEQANTKTRTAFQQLDRLLAECPGVSFQAVNTHIAALFWFENTMQDRWIQLRTSMSLRPGNPASWEITARVPNLSGMSKWLTTINSHEKQCRNSGITAQVWTPDRIRRFREKIQTIEKAVFNLATEQGWTMTDFYRYLRKDYLQSIEMAIINNSIYKMLAQQSRAQSQHKILYPLQIMIAAAQNEENGDLAKRVESYIRPLTEASETIHRTSYEISNAKSSLSEFGKDAQLLFQEAFSGHAAAFKSIFGMRTPVALAYLNGKLQRQILNIIKEKKVQQASRLFDECCRKRIKKIRTVVQYYFSLLPKEYVSVPQQRIRLLSESVKNSL